MSQYRRFRIPGGTYFFTVCLQDRGTTLLTDRIDILRQAYRATVLELSVACDAMVVLPDHIHAVWTLPEGDDRFSERWRRIKARFSHALQGDYSPNDSKLRKRERGILQRRYWEDAILNETEHQEIIRYCWMNPVKHGLSDRLSGWVFSSIDNDIRAGRLTEAWCGE